VSPRNRVSLILSAVLVVVGIAATIVSVTESGGSGVRFGYILGPALTLAGLGRGWLAWQMSRRQ
jgi:hypothetical protein